MAMFIALATAIIIVLSLQTSRGHESSCKRRKREYLVKLEKILILTRQNSTLHQLYITPTKLKRPSHTPVFMHGQSRRHVLWIVYDA